VSLARAQNPDGGWGAFSGGPSTTEATSLAALAMESAGDEDRAKAGLSWLRDRQRPDGAWPMSDAVPQPSWMTPLAVLALSRFEPTRPRAIRGARWILAQEGRGYPWIGRLIFRLFPKRRPIEQDSELKGWPWSPDTFSWVEPTAYALIALKMLRSELPRELAEDRIGEGERMIFDRMCENGGWNYGNSRVLGEDLWPYPDTTALALIALHDLPDRQEVRLSLKLLDGLVAANGSCLALSLAILCRRLYGLKTADLEKRLLERPYGVESADGTRSLALATLALRGNDNPFAFTRHAAP